MFKRLFVALLVMVMLVSVGVMLAQDIEKDADHHYRVVYPEGEQPFAIFLDGRLNATDLAAPLVVFYKHEKFPLMNPDGTRAWAHDQMAWGEKLTEIDVLAVQPAGNVDLALKATVEQIKEVMAAAKPGENKVIAQNGPVSLNYSAPGWFWVQGLYPDGKPYTFQWQAPDF